MSIVLSIATIFLIALFDLFRFGRYLPNYLITISSSIFHDATMLDYIYKNIGITLALSALMVVASIVLCKSKE